MTEIARLEALATLIHSPHPEDMMAATELRAIISALKQRDEAVRSIADEMDMVHMGSSPSSRMRGYAVRLRAALEGKHE